MSIVPGITSKFVQDVETILNSADRQHLPVLNPGVGYWVDKTTQVWFKFNHFLFQEIPDILQRGWVHEWPTYRLIPNQFKERWFLILAGKYTWDPKHTTTIWTQFNLVARTVFQEQMRALRRTWARGGDKPDWMLTRVWLDLVDMFEEFGPDDFGF